MTMTETAKHLAKPNSEPSSMATMESPDQLDLAIQRIHQKQFQQDLVQAITEQIEPLAMALGVIGKESRDNLAEMKKLSEMYRRDLAGSILEAQKSTQELQKRSQRLTLKLWVWMLLASLFTAAMSVISYSLWQQQHSGEKEAAARWKEVEARWKHITPEQQKTLHRILYGN